ncbi:SAVMC3_10250 family protein [Amycolatopsis sp. NPDC024027]|uniref:SAVMC3_10250 family protein n=1 Tax=Amycolatopsis sp. NPDC024027 TaxID=3154327 RepID=UPI0033E14652
MHELVYVSDAKLYQLAKGLPRGSGGSRDLEAEFKTPLGGFKIGRPARKREPSLAAAIRILNQSSRAPAWFAETTVRPGEWIQFESPLAHRVAGDAVIFLDDDEPSDEYPTGGRLRLLLHGSRRHLVGERPTDLDDDIPNLLPSSSWVTFGEYLLRTIDEFGNKGRKTADKNTWRPYGSDDVEHGIHVLTEIMRPRYAAAWMAGYARVTAVIPIDGGVVLAATPLYVEYIESPGIDHS